MIYFPANHFLPESAEIFYILFSVLRYARRLCACHWTRIGNAFRFTRRRIMCPRGGNVWCEEERRMKIMLIDTMRLTTIAEETRSRPEGLRPWRWWANELHFPDSTALLESNRDSSRSCWCSSRTLVDSDPSTRSRSLKDLELQSVSLVMETLLLMCIFFGVQQVILTYYTVYWRHISVNSQQLSTVTGTVVRGIRDPVI